MHEQLVSPTPPPLLQRYFHLLGVILTQPLGLGGNPFPLGQPGGDYPHPCPPPPQGTLGTVPSLGPLRLVGEKPRYPDAKVLSH